MAKEDGSSGNARLLGATDAPVLEAVINEALRLHPAAPASLQRATPVGGAQLGVYYIPEKVILCLVTRLQAIQLT